MPSSPISRLHNPACVCEDIELKLNLKTAGCVELTNAGLKNVRFGHWVKEETTVLGFPVAPE